VPQHRPPGAEQLYERASWHFLNINMPKFGSGP
jgi:hypothetical protein